MLPLFLTVLGGYLIGNSIKVFAEGGDVGARGDSKFKSGISDIGNGLSIVKEIGNDEKMPKVKIVLKDSNGKSVSQFDGFITSNNTIHPSSILTFEGSRRKGYATKIYDYLKEQGYDVTESKSITDEGKLFRSSVKPKGFAKGGEVELLAPNGKMSNLTPEQWHLVRTLAFKKWFGDWENSPEIASKVVDENGEPLVCYHGTTEKFTNFNTHYDNGTWHGRGAYFTSSLKDLKNNYVTTKSDIYLECFLDIKNPLVVGKKNEGTWFEKEQRQIILQKLRNYKFPRVNYAYEHSWDSDILEKVVREEFNESESGELLNSIYRELGFGGIIFLSPHKLKGHKAPLKTKHFVVFGSTQIKLADGSNTTFDSNNPDIRYSKGGKTKGGDCYYIAGQFAMNNFFTPKKINYIGTPYLIHAEVQGQGAISNLRYGHAWIEDDVFVYDFSNNRELVIPKYYYYKIGDVKTSNPKKYRKYTFEEARKKMLDTKKYGCWDLEVEYQNGGTL